MGQVDRVGEMICINRERERVRERERERKRVFRVDRSVIIALTSTVQYVLLTDFIHFTATTTITGKSTW